MEKKREIKDGQLVGKIRSIKSCQRTKLQFNPAKRAIVLWEATTEAGASPIKFCGLWIGRILMKLTFPMTLLEYSPRPC